MLRHPNRRVDDWRNWTASARPVAALELQPRPETSDANHSLRLNEVHFGDRRRVDWLEVFNPSREAVAAAGLYLASEPDFSDRQLLSDTVPAGGFASWETSFVNRNGEVKLYLLDTSNTVLDCRAFESPIGGDTWQAFPDGASEWFVGAQSTRDAANQPPGQTNIVINEIMYDPPEGQADGEYLELFNRGSRAVDLSGWKFVEGINFKFPAGTSILPEGYLVVAKSTEWMRSVYGDISVIGDFEGRLSNEGELIRLEDAVGNLVNEVDYRTGGAWPELADGGGSSLELIHPLMDNRFPSAWQASDESSKSSFRFFSCTNVYQERHAVGKPADFRELHLALVGSGHLVLNHLALWRNGQNCLTNADRLSNDGTGATGWLCQGTHWASGVTNGQLHVVSDGRGDDKVNRVEIDVPDLHPNETYAFCFDARWLSGKPRLIVQSWDRSIAGSFLIEVPKNLGSPGRRNSQATTSPLPQVDQLAHYPAVPRSTNTVTISARVFSARPLAAVQLRHRLGDSDGLTTWQSKPMFDDGLHGGDAVANDGLYTAQLAAYRRSDQVAEFYVEAETREGQSATMPRAGAEQPALFVVDDRELPRDLRLVRIVISPRDLKAIAEGGTAAHGFHFPRLSNHYFNGTLINDDEVCYGVKVRPSGSLIQRGADLNKVKLKLPEDHAFRESHEICL